MASVTLAGSGGTPTTIPFDSTDAVAVAQQLLASITSVTTLSDPSGPIPSATAPNQALLIGPNVTPGMQIDPPPNSGYGAFVDAATVPVVLVGTGQAAQVVIAGDAGLTFFTAGGSATVDAGGGNNLIGTSLNDDTGSRILAGPGNDTVVAASGDNTITAGAGSNLIGLGSGNNLVYSQGADQIVAGSGNATVGVQTGGGTVFGGSGDLTFVGGTGNTTVAGGSGSATLFGGVGGGLFAGGDAGNNILVAGQMSSTLFGGGPNSVVFAEGSANDMLAAGTGNQTLSGSNSTGDDTYFAGSGNDLINAGVGDDTVFAGSGNTTVDGAGGNNTFAFFANLTDGTGNTFVINDFTVGQDTLSINGYNNESTSLVLSTAQVAGNSTTLTLSDGTTIVLAGVTGVDSRAFG